MSVAVTKPRRKPLDFGLHRFSVDQYHQILAEGIISGNDRVELLEGWVVDKMPHNPPHDGSVTRINRKLVKVVPDEWVVRNQSAITLPDSEVEPDFAIVRGPDTVYFKRHALPKDAAVLMEVADSTLLKDRRWKGSLYARAGIPEYWIVNLVDQQVEVYTLPRGDKYRRKKIHTFADKVSLILAGQPVVDLAVRELVAE